MVAAGAALALLVAGCEPDEDEPDAAVETPPAEEPAEEPDEEVAAPEQAEHLAWVAVEDGDAVVLVDLDAGEVVEEHAAPGGPHNIVVADDGTVAAALYASTELLIVDDGEAELVELGGTPHDVKATGDTFVVANEIANRVDIVSHDGEHTDSIDVRAQPHDVGIHPDGREAWVTMNDTDELAVLDLDAGEVVDYVATGQSPHNLLFAPDGETFWVTDWDGPVHAFSADGEPLESFPVGEEAHHLAFTPHGSEVWAIDHATEEAYVFDVEALELLDEVDVPGVPHHVNITSDGALAAVADHTGGAVVVYDAGTREQLRTVDVGPGPHGVWVVP